MFLEIFYFRAVRDRGLSGIDDAVERPIVPVNRIGWRGRNAGDVLVCLRPLAWSAAKQVKWRAWRIRTNNGKIV